MATSKRFSRRSAIKLGAGAAALPLVHIRTAGAAGKLRVAFADHWVPAGSVEIRRLIQQWGDANKVEVQVDLTTGNTTLLSQAAEAQSRTGHDLRAFGAWQAYAYANQLEPMDDVMGRLIAKYGKPTTPVEYLAHVDGVWRSVPTGPMSKHMTSCARIDVFKEVCGLDIQAMYPARPEHTALADQWTWDNFIVYAEQCQRAGMPFALGVANNQDSVDWIGSLFASFGAELVDAQGNITVRSDAVREVLDYAVRLCHFLPPDVYGYDGAANNRALISGRTALIFEAPSAWVVAVKDNPQVGQNCWEFPNPRGKAGRFIPYPPQFWGIWDFSPNKSAAKELTEYLLQREQQQSLVNAAHGYDIPPFPSMSDFDVWQTEGPPTGVIYNYPIRPHHDSKPLLAGFPAPPGIAVRIFNDALMPGMIARMAHGGMTMAQTLSWAESELEGYTR